MSGGQNAALRCGIIINDNNPRKSCKTQCCVPRTASFVPQVPQENTLEYGRTLFLVPCPIKRKRIKSGYCVHYHRFCLGSLQPGAWERRRCFLEMLDAESPEVLCRDAVMQAWNSNNIKLPLIIRNCNLVLHASECGASNLL